MSAAPTSTPDVPQVAAVAGVSPSTAVAGLGRPARVPRRAVHGVLLLDKPLGLSSNDALQKVKRLLRAEKAGHTGTLDPLATGLLPLCFGAATKFSQVSLDADKRYTATLKLGQCTTTGDAEGEVVATNTEALSGLSLTQIEAACAAFMGEIDQVPPMHSALKHQGRALYEYARQGIEIERAPRRVQIHAIDILCWQDDRLEIDVRCSKGTYIRTLAEDIGQRLGCGAHLSALRRTGSGPLDVAQAVSLEALAAMDEAQRDTFLLPPDALLAHWPAVQLPEAEAGRLMAGMRRRLDAPDAPAVRVYGPNPTGQCEGAVFLGGAHIKAGELIPLRLLSPAEVMGLKPAPILAAATNHDSPAHSPVFCET
jgi:tRNA pseudouridine55 synthase